MKVRVIARSTLGGLIRNKLLILLACLFLAVILLMMTPLLAVKTMAAHGTAGAAQTMLVGELTAIMYLVSGCGSLLAAWTGAEAVSSEMRSGTILAVLARPVRRWEFLLGKYLGVQMLMGMYTMLMLALSYLLAAIGGERIHSAPLLLIVYPLVRYALYSAIALLLGTMLHPVAAFGLMSLLMVMEGIVGPGPAGFLPSWLHTAIYAVLPSPGLLSETRFLTITEASIKSVSWTDHAVALAYGLDWALVFFLLAAWSFHRRSLARG